MKRNVWVALGLVVLTILLFALASMLPFGGNPPFLGKFIEQRLDMMRRQGGPEVRAPAELPVPRRYIERTRAEVARRMAAPDWKTLSRDAKREQLLSILYVSGIDAEYWTMPEERQLRVADAYVRAFLDPH